VATTTQERPKPRTPRTVVVGRGEFGSGAVTALRAALDAMPDTAELVVDLSEVTFIDQRGVGALLGAAHRLAENGRSLVVRDAPPSIRTVLRSVGLHRWAAVA
jgi:anti-anti-sigma factor